jgi:beta-glucosidase
MTMVAQERRPEHISPDVWRRAGRLSVQQLVGQLTAFGPFMAQRMAGRSLEELVVEGGVGMVMSVADLPHGFLRLQELAVKNGQMPLLLAGDFQRGVTTVGPAGIGAPCSWNPALVERAARRAARQMAIAGAGLTFSPVADHALDTKQGRNQEGAAVESPLLMSDMVAAMVRGYQGPALRHPEALAATLKHWLGYQYTHGPDYTDSGASRRLLLEDCLPAFQAGFAADAAAVMYCFTTVDGVPAHASRYLHDLARSLGVKNLICISDYTGINELCEFGIAGTPHEATLHAFRDAGIHIDLNGGVYRTYLPELVDSRSLALHDLQVRAAEILQLKADLGLFDNPFKYGRPHEAAVLAEHDPVMTELAEESIVLLRPCVPNPAVLPIPPSARLLVTGPLADSKRGVLGEWCGNAAVPEHLERVVTFYDGLKAAWGSDNIAYVKGADFERLDETLPEALASAAHATHIFVALGERWDWSGESKARLMPKVPDAQVELVQRLREATGVNIIVSITAGRPLKIPDVVLQCADAILWVPQLGTHAGTALANVLLGKKNCSGRLAHALPCHVAVTSGFSHRERRLGRPSLPCNPQTFEYNSQGWGAYFQEIGERGSLAEYHHGEGYSYTEFALSHRMLSGASLSIAGGTPLTASTLVENVGTVAGKETVQLYGHDTVSEAVPRRLELLAYKQVELAPGESVEVSFAITPGMLAQYGVDLDEGRKPRPDPYPVYLFIVRHAGEAEAALFSAEPQLQFVLTR